MIAAGERDLVCLGETERRKKSSTRKDGEHHTKLSPAETSKP